MLAAVRYDIAVQERRLGVPWNLGASNWRIARQQMWPEKIVRAKLNTMMRRRGLVDGCNCGCRGDWTITS